MELIVIIWLIMITVSMDITIASPAIQSQRHSDDMIQKYKYGSVGVIDPLQEFRRNENLIPEVNNQTADELYKLKKNVTHYAADKSIDSEGLYNVPFRELLNTTPKKVLINEIPEQCSGKSVTNINRSRRMVSPNNRSQDGNIAYEEMFGINIVRPELTFQILLSETTEQNQIFSNNIQVNSETDRNDSLILNAVKLLFEKGISSLGNNSAHLKKPIQYSPESNSHRGSLTILDRDESTNTPNAHGMRPVDHFPNGGESIPKFQQHEPSSIYNTSLVRPSESPHKEIITTLDQSELTNTPNILRVKPIAQYPHKESVTILNHDEPSHFPRIPHLEYTATAPVPHRESVTNLGKSESLNINNLSITSPTDFLSKDIFNILDKDKLKRPHPYAVTSNNGVPKNTSNIQIPNSAVGLSHKGSNTDLRWRESSIIPKIPILKESTQIPWKNRNFLSNIAGEKSLNRNVATKASDLKLLTLEDIFNLHNNTYINTPPHNMQNTLQERLTTPRALQKKRKLEV